MGAKYTEAQKKASLAYQKERAQIKITISTELRDKYQQHAATKGLSMTQLIIELLDKDIESYK